MSSFRSRYKESKNGFMSLNASASENFMDESFVNVAGNLSNGNQYSIGYNLTHEVAHGIINRSTGGHKSQVTGNLRQTFFNSKGGHSDGFPNLMNSGGTISDASLLRISKGEIGIQSRLNPTHKAAILTGLRKLSSKP